MLKVYKYEVPVEDEFSLEIPAGATILSFQAQREVPQIWALVNPSEPTEPRQFRLAGTGHSIADFEHELKFIGTCQMAGGALVWHLFELIS
jgi:hypothetical protein